MALKLSSTAFWVGFCGVFLLFMSFPEVLEEGRGLEDSPQSEHVSFVLALGAASASSGCCNPSEVCMAVTPGRRPAAGDG